METLARFAGFLACHGIWSVSKGEVPMTMVAFERADGTSNKQDFPGGAAEARTWIARNSERAARMVLLQDTWVTLDMVQTQVIVVEAHALDADVRFVMATPYRNVNYPGGFAVHRPKLVEISPASADVAPLIDAFFQGVDSHVHGKDVWARALDQRR